jgi:hypothetical protein
MKKYEIYLPEFNANPGNPVLILLKDGNFAGQLPF